MDAIREKIEQVLKAEEEAKHILDQAHVQKERILNEARARIKQLRDQALRDAADHIAGEKELMKKDIEQETSALSARTEKEMENLRLQSRRNFDQAVSCIVKSLE